VLSKYLITNSMNVDSSASVVSPAHALLGLANTNVKVAGGGKKLLRKNVDYTQSI
jgi:hypothetical protein